jgi:hypothetical protein
MEGNVVIKRILLMDSHAQASAVVKAIQNRILELNQLEEQGKLTEEQSRERALLNEAYERMSSSGKAIPSFVTESNWSEWTK